MIPDPHLITRYWPVSLSTLVVRLRRGNGRTIAEVVCAGRPAIAKILPATRSPEESRADVAAIQVAAAYGLAPALIPMDDGMVLAEGPWGSAYLCDLVQGRHPAPTIDNLHALGELVGRLHLTPSPSAAMRWQDAACIAEIRARATTAEAPSWYRTAAIDLADLPPVPMGFIHTDAYLNNCLQRPDGSLVLIDWDDAGTGPFVTDLAYVCACSLYEGAQAMDLISGFASGYLVHRRITDGELACLPRTMLSWHLLYADFSRSDAAELCERIRTVGPELSKMLR